MTLCLINKSAPNYSNLFMAQWEKDALGKCPLQPDCYLRFLDDFFNIWPHPEQEIWTLKKTTQQPPSHHKATIHKNSVDFLDVTV